MSLKQLANHTPLINLALLETLKGENINDEIDLFIPYIALIVNEIESESFNISDVKLGLKERFGINPPESALKSILIRAKKKRVITQSYGVYFKNPEVISRLVHNANHKRNEIENSINRILLNFKEFSLAAHNKTLTLEECEIFLYTFLTEHMSTFVGIIGGQKAKIETKIKNSQFLTASYITNLYKEQPALSEDLMRVVKGMILSNYISYADKTTTKRHLENITIYLDSPILLGILGYSGRSKEVALNEFISLIKSLKVHIKVFDITIDEVQRLFSIWAEKLEKKNYSSFNSKTLELLRSKGIDKARLESESVLLESKLNDLDIDIVNNFKIDEEFNCDFRGLEAFLIRKGFENNLHHDITCVSRVFNLRKGKKISSLNDTFSLFVTLNLNFERYTNSHLINELPRSSIPVVITERLLSTILWLKNPKLFDNLPAKNLLADAYASIYADDRFWSTFITRLELLRKQGDVSENDFMLVRWDKSLMDKVNETSLDTGTEFDDDDVFEIVDSIKLEHTKESTKTISELNESNTRALLLKDIEIESKADELIRKDRALTTIEIKVASFSSTLSHVATATLSTIIFLLLVYAIAAALPPSILTLGQYYTLPGWLNNFSAFLLLSITILSLVYGLTLIKAYKSIHSFLFNKIHSLFSKQ